MTPEEAKAVGGTPELTTLRKDIMDEIHHDAPLIAAKLFSSGHPDAKNLQRGEYLHVLRTLWDSGNDGGIAFRTGLRIRLGDEEFIRAASEVHGLPHPKISDTGVEWRDPLEGLPDVGAEEMLMAEETSG